MSDFVITTAGLAAASAATPTGPYIEVVSFKLGSNSATAATVGDTNLAGSVVYTGSIASYSYYDSQTIQINMEVPAAAGPFSYGEIGIFLDDGTMFARFSYGTLRTKISSSVSGYANTLRIKALLRLSQGPAVFNFPSGTPQTILEITDLSLLQTPADHPANPVVIVHEPSDYQDSILLHKHTATLWTPDNYSKIGTTTVSAAPDSTHITAPLFSSLLAAVSGNRGKYIFQTIGGYFRSVVSISGSTALLGSAMDTGALVGTVISVYEMDSVRLAELAAALIAASSSSGAVPIGTVLSYYGTSAPAGYVELNGGLASRSTFADLFTHASTNTGGLVSETNWTLNNYYGRFSVGNGSTTFRLPDWRGIFGRGYDNSRGLDSGRVLGSIQADAIKAHTHTIQTSGSDLSSSGYVADASAPNINAAATGSTGEVETRPINVAHMWVMKAGMTTLPAGPSAYSWPPPFTISPTSGTVSGLTTGVAFGPVSLGTCSPSGTVTPAVTSGSLPGGCTVAMSGSVLQVYGTPAAAGTYNSVVTCTLVSTGQTATFALQMVVAGPGGGDDDVGEDA